MDALLLLPLHLGGLHPVEKVLTLVLAFGPFLLLAVVVVVRRRQDAREDARPEARGGDEPALAPQRDR